MAQVPTKYQQFDQTLRSLPDVEDTTPADGNVLVYSTTLTQWRPQAVPAAAPSLGDSVRYIQSQSIGNTFTRTNFWADAGISPSIVTITGQMTGIAGPILRWDGVSGAIFELFGGATLLCNAVGRTYETRIGIGSGTPTEKVGTIRSSGRSTNTTDYDNTVTFNAVFILNNGDFFRLQDRNGTTGGASTQFTPNSWSWGIRRIG